MITFRIDGNLWRLEKNGETFFNPIVSSQEGLDGSLLGIPRRNRSKCHRYIAIRLHTTLLKLLLMG